jgi:hypothetical protein
MQGVMITVWSSTHNHMELRGKRTGERTLWTSVFLGTKEHVYMHLPSNM